jgi:hypothetical protein
LEGRPAGPGRPRDGQRRHVGRAFPQAERASYSDPYVLQTIAGFAKLLHAILTRSDKLLSPKTWQLALADDLAHRAEKVIIPDPMIAGDANPAVCVTFRPDTADVGLTLLQAMVHRHDVRWLGLA